MQTFQFWDSTIELFISITILIYYFCARKDYVLFVEIQCIWLFSWPSIVHRMQCVPLIYWFSHRYGSPYLTFALLPPGTRQPNINCKPILTSFNYSSVFSVVFHPMHTWKSLNSHGLPFSTVQINMCTVHAQCINVSLAFTFSLNGAPLHTLSVLKILLNSAVYFHFFILQYYFKWHFQNVTVSNTQFLHRMPLND